MEHLSHPRVVVGVELTVSGYAALRAAVGIARSRRVPLQAIIASPAIGVVDQTLIDRAFREALGADPADIEVTKTVMFTATAHALAASASDPRDLIVVGNDGRGALRAFWSGSATRKLFKRAHCQILAVPAPEMHRATRRSLRRLRRPRTDVWDRFETEVPQLRGRPFQGI